MVDSLSGSFEASMSRRATWRWAPIWVVVPTAGGAVLLTNLSCTVALARVATQTAIRVFVTRLTIGPARISGSFVRAGMVGIAMWTVLKKAVGAKGIHSRVAGGRKHGER